MPIFALCDFLHWSRAPFHHAQDAVATEIAVCTKIITDKAVICACAVCLFLAIFIYVTRQGNYLYERGARDTPIEHAQLYKLIM